MTDSFRTSEWISNLVLTLIVATAMTYSLHAGQTYAMRLPVLTFSASASLFAVLFLPTLNGAAHLACWSGVIGLFCLLTSLPVRGLHVADATVMALTVALVVFALGSLRRLLSYGDDEPAASAIMAAVAFNLWAVPLSLAPLAEHFHEQLWFTDLVANLSPVSHLANALEIDYLRINWFYRYSNLGSLRFEYCSPVVTMSAWALVSLAARSFILVRSTRTTNP